MHPRHLPFLKSSPGGSNLWWELLPKGVPEWSWKRPSFQRQGIAYLRPLLQEGRSSYQQYYLDLKMFLFVRQILASCEVSLLVHIVGDLSTYTSPDQLMLAVFLARSTVGVPTPNMSPGWYIAQVEQVFKASLELSIELSTMMKVFYMCTVEL